MKRINANNLAKEVTDDEGKKVEVNIAQVKEVLRVTFELLSLKEASAVMELIERYRERALEVRTGLW